MIDLDKLYRLALEKAFPVKEFRRRYMYAQLEKELESLKRMKHKKPVLAVSGIRGVGKTTIMLQLFDKLKNSFYFSADSIIARTSTIYEIVEQAYRSGYENIFIDEIHKYPKWIDELKNIYDDFSIPVLVSGSSTASIKKGCISLGRRAVNIPLSPLTLGEFVYLKEEKTYSATLEDSFDKKSALKWLAEHPDVERFYKDYLSYGGFPLHFEEKNTLFRTIKKMIYEDALAEFNLSEKKVDIAERLLGFVSISKPGEFSYTGFSNISGYGKSTVIEAATLLNELEILRSVGEKSAKSKAKKSIKLMFSHPNLRSAVAEQMMKKAEIGWLREEYFVFHMRALGLPVFFPNKMKKNPDYEVVIDGKKLLFEIGGKSKTKKQLMGREGHIMDDERLLVLGFVR